MKIKRKHLRAIHNILTDMLAEKDSAPVGMETKSQVMADIAKASGYKVIDIPLSETDEGDTRGLPEVEACRAFWQNPESSEAPTVMPLTATPLAFDEACLIVGALAMIHRDETDPDDRAEISQLIGRITGGQLWLEPTPAKLEDK